MAIQTPVNTHVFTKQYTCMSY